MKVSVRLTEFFFLCKKAVLISNETLYEVTVI
jgi:hypothetical protein